MSHSGNVLADKEYFIKQIVSIEDNIKELTELYFSSTPLKERVKDFFLLYIKEVENYISLSKNHTQIPNVFIGTKVALLYEDDDDIEEFTICFPDRSNPSDGYISFLSPVGRQLLLKNKGDKTTLNIPTGSLNVKILNIAFAGD